MVFIFISQEYLMKYVLVLFLTFCSAMLFAQDKNIKFVKIDKQTWMKENLNVDKFRNGIPILETKSESEWKAAIDNKTPAWCYYNFDSSNETKYGKLYNIFAVHDSNGIAPKGWRVPKSKDWEDLANYFGGYWKAGLELKSNEGWIKEGNGTNSAGFSGLPAGKLSGSFEDIGEAGYWWIFDPTFKGKVSFSGRACARTLSATFKSKEFSEVYGDGGVLSRGYSVRCIKE